MFYQNSKISIKSMKILFHDIPHTYPTNCMSILSPQLQKMAPLEPFSLLVYFVDFIDFTNLMDFYNSKMMDSFILKLLPSVVELSKTVQIKYNSIYRIYRKSQEVTIQLFNFSTFQLQLF